VWTLPILPENLVSIFPDQKHRKTFHIKADNKYVISYFYYYSNLIKMNFAKCLLQFLLAKLLASGNIWKSHMQYDVSEFVSKCFVYRILSQGIMFINLRTNSKSILSLSIGYDSSPINADIGIPLAAVVLIILYILIIFEVNHVRKLECIYKYEKDHNMVYMQVHI